MSSTISLAMPADTKTLSALRCGDVVELSGVIYTARDAAHARFISCLESNRQLPFDPENQFIYYAGPTPAKPGNVIGSCGPTTAGRMDPYTPALLQAGIIGMVGKGPRSQDVVEAIAEHGAVYFAAVGGAAALCAKTIRSSETIAYEDLGPEAVRRLVVERYPCIVAVDSGGNSIYEQGPAKYRRT